MKYVKQLLVAGLMAGILCFALVGCNATTDSPSQDEQDQQATQTHIVTDTYNRQVEVPTDVQSVATVGSGARFVVYAGGQDKLIAVTEMETDPSPARPYTMVYKDKFTSLPSTSNGFHLMETNVNTELLLSLKPDVIISSRSAQECDDLQNAIGIPVIGISYQDQLFTEDVYNSILCVGKALGTFDHAQQVVEKLKFWEQDLNNRTKDIPEADKPSVYVGAVNYKGAQSFGGTYAQYAPLMAVNAKNVADETGQTGSIIVELEQIGQWNPDYMFLNVGNMDLLKADYSSNQAFFDSLKAFESGNLYSQPAFNMNGTNIEMGICDAYFIGFTLYPEQFSDLNPSDVYGDIFTTMLGANYYETMLEKGMDFTQITIEP